MISLRFTTPPIIHIWKAQNLDKKVIKEWKKKFPQHHIKIYNKTQLYFNVLKYRNEFWPDGFFKLKGSWKVRYVCYLLLYYKGGTLADPYIFPKRNFEELESQHIVLLHTRSEKYPHCIISPPFHPLWLFLIEKIEMTGVAPSIIDTGFDMIRLSPAKSVNLLDWKKPPKKLKECWWFWLVISLGILIVLYAIIHSSIAIAIHIKKKQLLKISQDEIG